MLCIDNLRKSPLTQGGAAGEADEEPPTKRQRHSEGGDNETLRRSGRDKYVIGARVEVKDNHERAADFLPAVIIQLTKRAYRIEYDDLYASKISAVKKREDVPASRHGALTPELYVEPLN